MANKQGIQFIRNRKKINRINVNNVIEGMTNAEFNSIKQEVNSLESDFNNKLNEYESTYRLYIEELSRKDSALNSDYKNKIIQVGNGENAVKYFVTKHGIYRKFSNDSWTAKDENCPSDIITVNQNVLDKLEPGEDMKNGELCISGGINIEKGDGVNKNQVAWLDIKGKKHIYNNFDGVGGKHNTCSGQTYVIPGNKYDLFNTSLNKWENTDRCEVVSFISDNSNKLIRLNNELFNIIETIKSKSDQINVDNGETTDYLSKGKLIQIRTQLLNERKKLNKLSNNSKTNMAIIEKNINKVNNIKFWHNILAGSSLIAIFYLLNKIV